MHVVGRARARRAAVRLERGDLPVLALTARTQPEDRAACMEAGADDYLVKPIDHNLLIERLDRALNREELTS